MVLLGLLATALASQLREGTAHGGPGTRFLPVLVGVIVAVLGAALAFWPGAPDEPAGLPGTGGSGRVAWTLGALVVYVLVLGPVGFVLATVPFLALLLLAYGERRWPVVLGVALGATGATYAVFAVWLGIPLPPGVLGR
jgi:putative tricarboxylic transport membrane protein